MLASSVQSPPQHQVFINFRGKQLRNSFISHLEKALRRDGINVFIDQNETRGSNLRILFKRIEESKIALAVFSSQYTDSSWCLDELEKISECVKAGKLLAIPIFYKVKTDDVKNLWGEFGGKFWELSQTCTGEKRDKWREALEAVSETMGVTINETSNESECITQIVGEVRKALNKISIDREREISVGNPCAREEEMQREISIDKPCAREEETRREISIDKPCAREEEDPNLPGIEARLAQLEEKLNSECKSTLTIGVVGMPGIGKTTLIKKLYEEWQGKFLRCVFLDDVGNMFKDGTINGDILIRELLKDENVNQEVIDILSPESLKALLLRKKSLVVLDNVSHKEQIKLLLGECNWMKEGSRIFITTSDRSVIEGEVDETYEVLRLTSRDSLLYFNCFAFRGKLSTADEKFKNLSRLFVDYAKGNPLVLKILGNELNELNETLWEEQLSKLKESPNQTIKDNLQKSYDGLDQLQKDVFLDVAYFFISADEYYVRCLVDSCDTKTGDAVSEIKDLASKFWINISGGRVEMHELLYAFGKELGSKGLHRLQNLKDVVGALKERSGGNNVRGIFFDMSQLNKKLPLDRCTFTKMQNLRYIKFYSSRCHRECDADCKLNFPEDLDFPMSELRYLYWVKFPLKKLPEDFNPKNLIDLNLPYSELKEVWKPAKDTPKLKWVDFSHSSKLCSLSGLQNAESLQRLNLEGCLSLHELPREMKRMRSLIFLNMRGCTSLRILPRMNLRSLKSLILTNCSSLQEFKVISENIETLNLDGTAITKLPTNLVKLQRLIVLNLKDCKMLRVVPSWLGKLKALQELVLSGCSKLKSFQVTIENMKCLQILLLDGTAITDMPKILLLNRSKVEDLQKLTSGMNGLSTLRRLCLSKNDKVTNLQIGISQLYHLKWLDLKYCKNLTAIPLLPPNLEILDAHGCGKLKTVASPMALLLHTEQVHSKFVFTNCNTLEQAAKDSITSYAQRKSQLAALRSHEEGNVSEALVITSFPGSEVPSWFNHRTVGSTLKLNFPPHWCDNRLSTIVLCAVVEFPYSQDEINRFSIECTCEFKNGTVTCLRFTCNLGEGLMEPQKVDLDHVFIGYTSSSHLTKHLEGSLQSQGNHRCVPTDASIKFKVIDGKGEIVNCGLSLVYEEPKDVVVEGNSSGIFSRSSVWLGVVIILVYGVGRAFH